MFYESELVCPQLPPFSNGKVWLEGDDITHILGTEPVVAGAEQQCLRRVFGDEKTTIFSAFRERRCRYFVTLNKMMVFFWYKIFTEGGKNHSITFRVEKKAGVQQITYLECTRHKDGLASHIGCYITQERRMKEQLSLASPMFPPEEFISEEKGIFSVNIDRVLKNHKIEVTPPLKECFREIFGEGITDISSALCDREFYYSLYRDGKDRIDVWCKIFGSRERVYTLFVSISGLCVDAPRIENFECVRWRDGLTSYRGWY